jgi:hypothetical protein
LDRFVSNYFLHGAVKATLIGVPTNTSKEEREKVDTWWNSFIAGGANAWRAKTVNADELKVQPIGEGLEALSDKNLTQQTREGVATAFGISQSLLMSNAANYATATIEDRQLIEKNLGPRADFIAEVLNDQAFETIGLNLKFRPEELDSYQEDENDRATAFKTYVDGGIKPSIAAEMLGLELPEGVKYADLDPKEKPIPPQLQPFTGQPVAQDQPPTQEPPAEMPVKAELARWERKALRALKAGKPAAVEFVSDEIPASLSVQVLSGLQSCRTPEDVRAAFLEIEKPEREKDAALVLEGLRLAVEAMKNG